MAKSDPLLLAYLQNRRSSGWWILPVILIIAGIVGWIIYRRNKHLPIVPSTDTSGIVPSPNEKPSGSSSGGSSAGSSSGGSSSSSGGSSSGGSSSGGSSSGGSSKPAVPDPCGNTGSGKVIDPYSKDGCKGKEILKQCNLDFGDGSGAKCGSNSAGGPKCYKKCAAAVNTYCAKVGGGQNKQCYLDRGIKVCQSKDEKDCWPNMVACGSFNNFDTSFGNKCGDQKMGGKRCYTDCIQEQINFCESHGGGQNETCYTDRGVKTCASASDVNCWPNTVPCEDFGDKGGHFDTTAYGKCGTQRQGGSICKKNCCQKQWSSTCKNAINLNPFASDADRQLTKTNCMKDRGCSAGDYNA